MEQEALDRALASKGSDLIIRRRVGKTDGFVQIGFRGLPRGYEPQEVSGNVFIGDTKVICSPKAFWSVGFGAAGGKQWPRKGDEILLEEDRWTRVEAVNLISVANKVVRLELQVRG